MPDHFSAECQSGPWEAGQGPDLSPAFVEWKFSPFQGTVLRSASLLSSPWGLGSSLSQSWGAHRRPLGQAWVPRGAVCRTVSWFTGWLLCGTIVSQFLTQRSGILRVPESHGFQQMPGNCRKESSLVDNAETSWMSTGRVELGPCITPRTPPHPSYMEKLE